MLQPGIGLGGDDNAGAAALIVEEAGGIITDHHGETHRYNCASPRLPSLVASGKAMHPLLIERTDRVDL